MAFSSQAKYLRTDLCLSFTLAILGLVILGTMGRNNSMDTPPLCLLLLQLEPLNNHPSACTFSIFSGVLITAAAIGLLSMDYTTYQRSENFKGKRASVTALLVAPFFAFFSLASAIVFGVGLNKTCHQFELDTHGLNCTTEVPQLKSLYNAVSSAALAGILFSVYGYLEYQQYRKRHVHGDKW